MSDSSKSRVGVVGVGYLGRFHAQKWAALAREGLCVFAGVCDANLERATAVAQELETSQFPKPVILARVGRLTAAVVASATPAHFENTEELLESGVKYILVEKPLTHNLTSSEKLLDLAEKAGAELYVGQSERFQPIVSSLREHLAEASFLQIERAHAPSGRSATTSVILDLMIHDLDLLLWLSPGFSPQIVHVEKKRNAEGFTDWCSVVLKMVSQKSGTSKTVFLRASRVVAPAGPTLRKWILSGAVENHFDFLQTKADTLMLETRAFLAAVTSPKAASDSVLASGADGLRALRLASEIENWERLL